MAGSHPPVGHVFLTSLVCLSSLANHLCSSALHNSGPSAEARSRGGETTHILSQKQSCPSSSPTHVLVPDPMPDSVYPSQAYMEDHLKNKNRLEKEWEALCAYQAEPNSSLVAQKEENASKNRSLAVLTCTYLAWVN